MLIISYNEEGCFANNRIEINQTGMRVTRVSRSNIKCEHAIQYFRRQPGLTPTRIAESCFASATKQIGDLAIDVAIVVSGRWIDDFTTGRLCQSANSSPEVKARSEDCRGIVPIKIMRFANHVPLPDSTSTVSCGLCSALTDRTLATALKVLFISFLAMKSISRLVSLRTSV